MLLLLEFFGTRRAGKLAVGLWSEWVRVRMLRAQRLFFSGMNLHIGSCAPYTPPFCIQAGVRRVFQGYDNFARFSFILPRLENGRSVP